MKHQLHAWPQVATRKNIILTNVTSFAALLYLMTTFLCAAAPAPPDPEGADAAGSRVLPLSGSDWRIHDDPQGNGAEQGMAVADVAATDWVAATVPGNIQADLEAVHLLKPLWYGAGDPRLPEVARKDWWYRKDFTIPETFAGKRLTLVFDGVDYECEVWLNGKAVGRNSNMYRRFNCDVTEAVLPGVRNRLAVRIVRMPDALAPLVTETDGEGVSSAFMSGIHETRKALKDLKSPTNWGWDWGVNIWTLGIWKDVRLEATGPARIDWTRIQTTLNDDFTKATVKATLEIDSSADLSADVEFHISGQSQKANLTVATALKKGRNVVEAELAMEQPALWWPNGQGEQALYTIRSQVRSTDGGTVSDARVTRFGIRDVRWIHTEGAPADFISRYQLLVNGRPIRTIGSNLIPLDLLFGRMGPRTLNLLRRAKAAGMNTIRIWGGGVILHNDAYALADELGIMLSQEFPIANCSPETDPVFLANLEATSRNIVRQVRNHPSIIEFAGGNEMNWNSLSKDPALEIFKKVVEEEDGRLCRATCPDLGANHSPWDFSLDSSYRHYDGMETMRYGEFGTQSPANLEVWQRTIPPRSQWPIEGVDDPILIRKNVVRAVFSEDHWLLKKRIDKAFGPADNLADMIQAGQFLGAEGLRYAVDALRRKGRRIGGFTTWDFDEPWPNGAGSYLIDHDGRPLMNYDFVKQALSPVSLSLKYDSIFYNPAAGLKLEVWLASDAPQTVADLKWKLLARDRRGKVFAREQGSAAIEPLETKQLKTIQTALPGENVAGPIVVEMQLFDAHDKLVVERLHVFAATDVQAPLSGLLINRQQETDDQVVLRTPPELPDGSGNLAFAGNGAKPATASSSRAEPGHQSRGINDGIYGNGHSWIGTAPRSWFEIDLGKTVTVGRYKLGRDRTGEYHDRGVDSLKIEVSVDGKQWQTAFEQKGIAERAGFDPAATLEIHTVAAPARFVKVTVDPQNPGGDIYACIDEFEVYAPLATPPAKLPQLNWLELRKSSPVRRTELTATALPPRIEDGQEVLDLILKNTGTMTAIFCEAHPLLEYRTDLFLTNNHCFIPPGESRTLKIRASSHPAGGLSLAQTGWRISTWNANDVVIEATTDVLLAAGRRDNMCREFAGYGQPPALPPAGTVELDGRRPDPASIPYLLGGGRAARFHFPAGKDQLNGPTRLRVHLSDQDADMDPVLRIVVNHKACQRTLPRGLGLQRDQPYHLAFPGTISLELPAGLLNDGENTVELGLANESWITLDALDLVTQ